MNKNDFIKGFVCAIVTYIRAFGVNRNIVEVFRAGIGNKYPDELRKAGVSHLDMQIIEDNYGDLYGV